ncbi:hypothetical protein HDV00_010367 [Rhizophlyctis rosea]|nr:hypothetical protein HDV00_010367 [Rhizophlyctis rosea]
MEKVLEAHHNMEEVRAGYVDGKVRRDGTKPKRDAKAQEGSCELASSARPSRTKTGTTLPHPPHPPPRQPQNLLQTVPPVRQKGLKTVEGTLLSAVASVASGADVSRKVLGGGVMVSVGESAVIPFTQFVNEIVRSGIRFFGTYFLDPRPPTRSQNPNPSSREPISPPASPSQFQKKKNPIMNFFGTLTRGGNEKTTPPTRLKCFSIIRSGRPRRVVVLGCGDCIVGGGEGKVKIDEEAGTRSFWGGGLFGALRTSQCKSTFITFAKEKPAPASGAVAGKPKVEIKALQAAA